MYAKIGKVAMQVGLSIKRIREYEKEGFIRPLRCESSNQRLYSEFDISQILQVKKLIHERGMTVEGIKHLLNMAPCWSIFGCPNVEACPAYRNPYEKCWEVKQRAGSEMCCSGECSICPIYLSRSKEILPLFEKTPTDIEPPAPKYMKEANSNFIR
jgi:MerR family transcriptional regulator, repressor of the yfmOP operon